MRYRLLLGDEAIAQAALDAGIGGAFSYPGTPATEIFEYIAKDPKVESGEVSARWSTNEKVAYEEALGMSWVGKRSLVSMKHVGLNVAADPFINSALTGINAGLVLLVADDPGMHSSQNEQDSRFYGDFAQVPILEPGNQQEAYDFVLRAFDLSERLKLPVMVRIVTRLSHSRGNVGVLSEAELPVIEQRDRPPACSWTLVPAIARARYAALLVEQVTLTDEALHSPANTLHLAGKRGVITCGIARNYVLEATQGLGDLSMLHLGQYPVPAELVRRLVDHCDDILVCEDGYPLVEKKLVGLLGVPAKRIRGRLTGDLPASGELNPDIMAAALGMARKSPAALDDLANRPPQLCRGCPHIDSFSAIVQATQDWDPMLFSDIGCYTLGVAPPYRAVHTCVDMGASISMALGASRAGAWPVLCTIGDSTFAHSGMTPLLAAARADANMTVVILDNATTAMTGDQSSLTTGPGLLQVLQGLGVSPDHIHVIEPLHSHQDENVAMIRHAVEHKGLSVIVSARACVQSKHKPTRIEMGLDKTPTAHA
jgi:indolepyruvate ferredoxin oxidoreductase alpha subunit